MFSVRSSNAVGMTCLDCLPSRDSTIPSFSRRCITREALFHPMPCSVIRAFVETLFRLKAHSIISANCLSPVNGLRGIEDVPESEFEVHINWEASCSLWRKERSFPIIYERISSDCRQLQDLALKARNAEETKINLDFLERIFLNHEKVCRLFSKITGGKQLVMYYP